MHRAGLRTALVTLLVLSSPLVYSAAFAQLTVSYVGDTPSSGPGVDGLWDYRYNLSGTVSGPTFWGIASASQPLEIINAVGWSSVWAPLVSTGDFNGVFDGTALIGHGAVVWEWDYSPPPSLSGFGFQSTHQPVLMPWASYGNAQARTGTEWSASPEPASMALTSLCLIGVAAWRRRRAA